MATISMPTPVTTTDLAPAIRSIGRSDRDRAEAALTLAFSADPILRWAFPDPLTFVSAFASFAALFGGKSLDHGGAYAVGDFAGVAQWLPPGVQPADEPLVELFERNMPEARFGEVLLVLEQMARFHPRAPHWHLALIGVDPLYQGRGYGTLLMRQGLAVCDSARLCAYLEASSPANRAFYERHGFRVLGEIRAGGSPPVFPMLREPR